MDYNYSNIERKVAFLFQKYPKIKLFFKRMYQIINFVIFKKKYKYKIFQGSISEIGNNSYETFFGYYDKSPVNKLNSFIIYHESIRSTRKRPSPTYPINIVLKDLSNNSEFRYQSFSYNWQQGARLQWLDEYNFIFNDYNFEKKEYCSYLINAPTHKVVKIYDFPIYDTHNTFGYTLNFDRLAILRPDYGYRNKINDKIKINIKDIKNDGIYYCDLINNKKQLLISLEFLSSFELYCSSNTLHKVNHIMISPDGDKFVFLHRYFVNGIKYDRLILSSFNGQNIKLVYSSNLISHYYWLNNNSIVVYMKDNQNKLGYKVFSFNDEIISYNLNFISNFGDGHPNAFRNYIIFDTYPDRSRMKQLYLYNLNFGDLIKIGEFFEPLSFNSETRCDLHPRWSTLGSSIFIDSVHFGYRKLYVLVLDNENR